MRRSLGVAVFAGMLGVTLFGIFLTPVFFYVIQWFGGAAAPRVIPVTDVEEPWPNPAKTVAVALEELRQNPRDDEARRRAREALKKAMKELNE
jgi:hypothetical protein